MRAREFIVEQTKSHLHPYQEKALAGAKAFPNMDQYYELYRFGIAMAGSPEYPEHEPNAQGPVGNHPSTISYTEAEEDIIRAALKKVGKSELALTSADSGEPDDTNRRSPVAPAKKNRYGV